MEPMIPQTPTKKLTGKKIVIYGIPVAIFFIVVLAILFKLPGNKSASIVPGNTDSSAIDSTRTSAIGGTEVAIGDVVNNRSVFDMEPGPAPHELTPPELRNQLEHQLAISADLYFEPENALNLDDLRSQVIHYVYWGQLINTAKKTADPVMKSLAKQLQVKLVERQLVEFPHIRKRYAEINARALSPNKIIVEVQGSRNDEICFISNAFKDSEYTRAFHMQVVALIKALRFKETRYFIQPGVETDHYQPGSYPDTEILEHFG